MLVFFLLLLSSVLGTIPVLRSVFNNYHANFQHDGFTNFTNDPKIPLNLKWTRDYNSGPYCIVNTAIGNGAMGNGILYCLGSEASFNNVTSSILGINISNGNIIWQNYLYETPQSLYLNGIVYSEDNNYVSVVDEFHGVLFVLDGSTGDTVMNMEIYDGCRKIEYCMFTGILGVSNGVFINFVPANSEQSYIFSLNFATTTNSTVLGPLSVFGCQLSLCNNGNSNILILFDNFESISAYTIDDTLTIQNLLWFDNVTFYGLSYIMPAECIPTIDENNKINGCQILFTRKVTSNGENERWILLDGNTGSLIDHFKWSFNEDLIPVIDINNNVIIRSNINNTQGYLLNSNNNGIWNSIWVINNTKFEDIIVINEYLFAVNSTDLSVYYSKNGEMVNSYSFEHRMRYPKILSGVDGKNEVFVMVIGYNEILGDSIYAF